MNIRRLEIFCRVVELGSFTKAAEALLLSQPTVSEHIRALEQVLGDKMIDRLGREVLPTPAGKVFYRYARDMVRMRDEAVEALARFKGRLAGQLVLGASTIPGTYILPEIIASFKAIHPAIQITVRIADTAEITRDVAEGDAEAGLIGSVPNDRRLKQTEAFSDELVLAVHPDHRWAERAKVELEELEGEPFVLREKGSGTRSVTERILERHGFNLSRVYPVAEMGSTEAVRQGVKAGIGIAILSRRAIAEDLSHGSLIEVEIQGVGFSRPLYLIQRRNRQPSPLCQAFLDYLEPPGR